MSPADRRCSPALRRAARCTDSRNGLSENFFNTFDRYPSNNRRNFYECVRCKRNMHKDQRVERSDGRMVSVIEVDHIHPQSKTLSKMTEEHFGTAFGFSVDRDSVHNARLNLQPLCIPCNRAKSDQTKGYGQEHWGHWVRQ
jgi:5-methylcytosine-specific restriction endonuclease McrA